MMATGRFAPSPTGPLHLGSLRTALVAWLFARASGGRFLLRIEDLNPVPESSAHEASQQADLRAIGLDWDGDAVRQSARRDRHEAALERLVADGHTYECFCSRREVREAAEAPHGPLGVYPGTCRDLSDAERARRRDEGRTAALRLRTDRREVTIVDRLHGSVTATLDDVVLRRNDGVPAYNLAVVVDDAEQRIDEVVRGDDLLDITPTHAHLADLLGVPRPRWAHVPLVLGSDGQRLAKRHGAVTLAVLAADGAGPDAVRSRLAWSLGLAEEGEPVTPAQLVARFDPDRLPRHPWVI